MVGSSVRNSSFIGRQREMAELTRVLEDTLAGSGRMIMLVGEPGIGKTRTAEELAAIANERGAHVLWGWCYEDEGAPPYWPWVQPLRSYMRQQDPELLRAQMGLGAADIAEIIPEVREKLPGLEPPPALEPEQARFRLFDSIAAFLRNASQSQPLVLVLDDLHWADKPSLLLLQFLARQVARSQLLVMGCYRDVELSQQHPLSETLAHLSREPAFQRVLLQGISEANTARFIEATASIQPSQRLVGAIYAHTEGNPFFMTEVVRLLLERGDLSEEAIRGPQGFRIPEGVKEVIGQRLNRLSQHCLQTLTIASVIGREFEFKLLNILNGMVSDEQLLGLIEEALEARLIEELPGRAERYQFSHALIQETLLSELSAARQARLHARVGGALEDIYGSDEESHASELARHFAEAVPVIGSEKLVRYSLLAGEQALATYAYEEALTYFQRGLTACGIPLAGTEVAPDAQAAELLFGLGRAQTATAAQVYQMQEAIDTLGRALDYYAKVGDVPRAMAMVEYPLFIQPGFTRAHELIARALELVPPDSHEAGHLFSRYGFSLSQEVGDFQKAQEAFSRALAIARQQQDVVLEMRTLAGISHMEFTNLRFPESLEKSLGAIELTNQVYDPHAAFLAHYSAFLCMWMMGDPGEMRQHATSTLAVAEGLRHQYKMAAALWFQQCINLAEGDWNAARDVNEYGLAAGGSPTFNLSIRAKLEHEIGDFVQGGLYLERLLDSVDEAAHGLYESAYFSVTIPAIARITGAMNHFDSALRTAEVILASHCAFPIMNLFAKVSQAMVAAQRGDSRAALEQYAALEAERGPVLYVGCICLDRLLGLLARTIGYMDRAIQHFEDGLTFCRRAGYRPEYAWTCYDYANLLHQQGQHLKALSLLEEALAISTELGMKPLMEKVTALKEQVEAQQARTPQYPAGLTAREIEVLRLLTSGSSNAAIADKLVLSVRTVERHISNIYSKTNTHGRAEATAFAFTHGLVPITGLRSFNRTT